MWYVIYADQFEIEDIQAECLAGPFATRRLADEWINNEEANDVAVVEA